MESADSSRCRQQFRHCLRPVWWGWGYRHRNIRRQQCPSCPRQLSLRGCLRHRSGRHTLLGHWMCYQHPDVSFYVPTTSPVTPAQTLDTEFLSTGGPASMDSLIVGGSSLMDRDNDLPLLPLPLLPLPDSFGLLQDTALKLSSISVAGLSTPDTGASVVPLSGDLSRRGPLIYTAVHLTWGTSR